MRRIAADNLGGVQRWSVGLVLAGILIGVCFAASTGTAWGLPSCVQSGQTVNCTYAAGATSTFTVPAGVIAVRVRAVGGTGGGQSNPLCEPLCGGSGATVNALVGVSNGQILGVAVGGNAEGEGRTPGSGGGGSGCYGGGGGSFVSRGGQNLVIAGGGGGNGCAGTGSGGTNEAETVGGEGGEEGGASANSGDGGRGGMPGSGSVPGLGGAHATFGSSAVTGESGKIGQGGAGGVGETSLSAVGGRGGGGGGGYAGGGGGRRRE